MEKMKHKPVKQNEKYEVKDGKIERKRRLCPRCGDSFLAKHKDRETCGKCGWSEMPK